MRRPVALFGCALVSAIGCAQTLPPVEMGFRPFAGERSARVNLRAPDGQGARSAAGLVERLTALGVSAKVVKATADRVVIRLARVRDPAALVRAVARPDWWRIELVEPEPPPPAPQPPADPNNPFGQFIHVETMPVLSTERRRPQPATPNGRTVLSSTERLRAFIIPLAIREEAMQHPGLALEEARHRDDPAFIAATREPRLGVESTPEVARRIRQWTGENVGRLIALVVGSEILLLSTVHYADRFELTLTDETRAADVGLKLGEKLLRVVELRAEVGTLEIE